MSKFSPIAKIAGLLLASCATTAFAANSVFYSLLDSKGKVLMNEDEMLVGKIYHCGIDLTEALKPQLNESSMCGLDEGVYFLQSRTVSGGEENVQKFDFSVTTTKYYFSLLDSKGNVLMDESKMLAGGKYYCGGIDLTDSLNTIVNLNVICDLDFGDYTLQLRVVKDKGDSVVKSNFTIAQTKYYFSLLDSKGKVLMDESKMLAGNSYYCGGINLTNPQSVVIDKGSICNLGEGGYTLQTRAVTGAEKDVVKKTPFTIAQTKYYFSLLDSNGKVLVGEDKMLVGKSYYCGGIDLTDPSKAKIDMGVICNLDEGRYALQRRYVIDGKDIFDTTSFTIAQTKYFFSLLDSKGKVLMDENKMLAGEKYYCGGIDLTNPQSVNVNKTVLCDLDAGDYTLQTRAVTGDRVEVNKFSFSIAQTAQVEYYFSLLDSKGKVVMGEDKMLAGGTYYCGGIDLTDPQNVKIDKSALCDLDSGNYVLQYRVGNGSSKDVQKFDFSVASSSKAKTGRFYSLLNSKGEVLMGEDKMLAGGKYYCGGIDLSDSEKPKIDIGSLCDLDDGDYELKIRVVNGSSEDVQKTPFSIAQAKYYFSLLDSKGKVVMGEDKMLAGKSYYCGGIDLSDPQNVKINKSALCDLGKGNYVLQSRAVSLGKDDIKKHEFSVTETEYFYSLLDSKGKVLMGEDKMLAGKSYYCGGINLTDPQKPKIDRNVLCDLDDGDYVLRSRTVNGSTENVQKFDFSVSSSAASETEYFYSLLNSKGKVVMGEDKMLVGKTYYCGIDLSDPLKPKVDMNVLCDLDEGDYTLKFRSKTGDGESVQNFKIIVSSTKYFFSLLDSKGKVVMGEDKMLAGEKYYCGGIDLTNPMSISLNKGAMCDLDDGDYVLQSRVQNKDQSKSQKYEFTLVTTKVYYSVQDSKGKVILGEDKMLAGKKYFCSIDLTDPLSISIGAEFCDIEKGKYVFKIREVTGKEENVETHDFEVVKIVSALPEGGMRVSVAKISVTGRIMDLSLDKARVDYSVMDLQGRVIARGVLQSHQRIVVPMAGSYLVKIGSEVRKVNVR